MRCIYRIDINKRYYIGSTINLKERKRTHFTKLRGQYHPNRFLQNLYNKHGEKKFKFSVVEILSDGVNPLEAERPYLEEHFGKENCVNLTHIAGGGQLYTVSPETIQKQLDTRLNNGNWYPTVKRFPVEAISANTGSKRSPEFCKKMSDMLLKRHKETPDNYKKFKDAATNARKIRWDSYDRKFVLIKDNIEYGPFKTQTEVFKKKILSQLSISRLFLGKLNMVKGYSLRFIDTNTK